MRRIKLTRQEKAIEESLLKGEFSDIGKQEFAAIAHAVSARRKDAVLNIRVNSQDLQSIKHKAQRLGIRYQTFISELLHKIAQAH